MEKSCIFCDIIAGNENHYAIFENQDWLGFLDTRPLFPGHTLLVPKKHVENITLLDPSLASTFFTHIQNISEGIEKGLSADGTFIAINNKVSQSVPHLHAHIVPRKNKDGLKGFFWPRTRYLNEAEILNIQSQIKRYIK